MARQMWEIKSAIADAIHSLFEAERFLTEMAVDRDGEHPDINDLLGRVMTAKPMVEMLLPLHPDFEAEIKHDEEEAMDRYRDWLASGNHPRL